MAFGISGLYSGLMLVMGIETSCDETAVALVQDGTIVRSSVIASSRAAFEALAGVIPEEAARRQVECMVPVAAQALREAGADWKAIDAIAVTRGPGLMGSLLVGTTFARMVASVQRKPLIGVHHTLGHLSSTWLGTSDDPPSFPVITLSASGGHSDIWYRTSHTVGRLIGRTRDDAAGEAFDKGASMLGLPYPGGPSIARAAEGGDETRFPFPEPLKNTDSSDFSFSGLKTSLRYLLRDAGQDALTTANVKDYAASFQFALCRHLCQRTLQAIAMHPDTKEVHIVGGVSANTRLRSMLNDACTKTFPSVRVRTPLTLSYCTDNAAMIAATGYFLSIERSDAASAPFETMASLPLEDTVRAQ